MRKSAIRLLFCLTLVLILLCGFGAAYAIDGNSWSWQIVEARLDPATDAMNAAMPSKAIAGVLCDAIGLDETDPYVIEALGCTDAELPETTTREFALITIARAFSLKRANPDIGPVIDCTDGNSLSGEKLRLISSLVQGGYITPVDGSLGLTKNLTGIEFAQLLDSVVGSHISAAELTKAFSGQAVISGDAELDGNTLGNVWFDATTESISMNAVRAGSIVVRSANLSAMELTGNCAIGTLTFANESGDVNIDVPCGSVIRNIVVGDCGEDVEANIGGSLFNVEITGNACTVAVSGLAQNVTVSGSGNNIRIVNGADIKKLSIIGENNTITVNGKVADVDVLGAGTELQGFGRAEAVNVCTGGYQSTLLADSTNDSGTYGLESAQLNMSTNAGNLLPLGQTLIVDCSLSDAEAGLSCSAVLTIDGVAVEEKRFQSDEPLSFSYDYDYSKRMNTDTVAAVLIRHISEYGTVQELNGLANVKVENHDAEYYDVVLQEQALAEVTDFYGGDYTLAWAQENDYDSDIKEAFVAAENYASDTEYLVWINKSYQRVNIFTGSQGDWALIKTFFCATGRLFCSSSKCTTVNEAGEKVPMAPHNHNTPTGVYKIIKRDPEGWVFPGYYCKPVVYFTDKMAMHSRLHNLTKEGFYDGTIGYPISHGCVRMYDEDIQWIYDNVIDGSTVVVH